MTSYGFGDCVAFRSDACHIVQLAAVWDTLERILTATSTTRSHQAAVEVMSPGQNVPDLTQCTCTTRGRLSDGVTLRPYMHKYTIGVAIRFEHGFTQITGQRWSALCNMTPIIPGVRPGGGSGKLQA